MKNLLWNGNELVFMDSPSVGIAGLAPDQPDTIGLEIARRWNMTNEEQETIDLLVSLRKKYGSNALIAKNFWDVRDNDKGVHIEYSLVIIGILTGKWMSWEELKAKVAEYLEE